MEYLKNIGSYLPDLSPAVQSVWQGWQQVTQIDSLYLAVAGGFLLFSLVVIIAIKKWKARQSQKSQTKSQEKHKAKPQGIKNIKNEEAEKYKPSKWKKPDSKPSIQKPEEKSKSTWFGGLTEKIASVKEEIIPNTESAKKPAEQKKGWFSSSQPKKSELSNPKSDSAKTRDSFMKPVHLNIDPNPVPKNVLKKKTEGEIQRVRRMCGEFREVVKGNSTEEREEKQKEMEKVRSARTYFKTADRYRSESLSANPRIKFRTEEEVSDSYSRGNQNRLSQFTPGKINSRFTDLFGGEQEPDLKPQKAPKKKIITLNQVLKQESPKSDENRISKELELEDLKQSRKKWKPPQLEKHEPISNVKDEIITLQFESVPLKLRWNPTDYDEKEGIKCLEIPNKLNIDKVFPNQSKEEDAHTKIEVEKELDEIRLSRPKRFQKIGKEERSSSAHVLQRVKLPDDSWVVEKSESRIKEERKKAIAELELVKQARLETLEAMENMEIERPSSRLEDQVRYEAMKELEEVRKARTVSMQEEVVKSDVIKILENQLSDESSSQIITEDHSKVIGKDNKIIDTAKEEHQAKKEDSIKIVLHEVIDAADEMNEMNQKVLKHVSFEEDTKVTIDVVAKNEPIAKEDSDETLSTSVDSQINADVLNEIKPDEDLQLSDDADDNSEGELVVSNQITDEDDTKVATNAVTENEPIFEEDSDETLSTSVDNQVNVAVLNEIKPDEDLQVADDANDNSEVELVVSNLITDTDDTKVTTNAVTENEPIAEEVSDETLSSSVDNQINVDLKVADDADDNSEGSLVVSNQITDEDDTNLTTNAVAENEPIVEEDSDETLSTSVDSQINLDNSNQIETEGDLKVTGDADDNSEKDQVVSNQITDDAKNTDEEKNRIRSEQVNVKAKEREMSEIDIAEEEPIEETQDDLDTQEQLAERVKELTEFGDIRSLDIAMAIAAEGMMEFEEFKGTQSYNDESYEELDEDFEEKKKIIEEELRLIEEQYKAVQEQASQDVTTGSDVITPAVSYEELTERLLKVAESIQDSAKRLGNEDIDLSPRIDRIQSLRDECQLSNQSLPVKDNFGEIMATETDAQLNLESIKSDNDEAEFVEQNEDLGTMCAKVNGVSVDEDGIPDAEPNEERDEVCVKETNGDEQLLEEYVKEENLHEKKIEIIQKARASVLQINDEDLKQISDDPKKPRIQKIVAKQDPKQFENRFSSINAVPKIRFKGQFQTNQKRNTIDLGQFEPAKINTKFKNIFENKGSNEEIEVRRHPRKKLITLDQVLIKSSSQDINHEKEIELEIVKNLRKNWVPPEDLNIEATQTKLEPKKLQIAHVYGNDSRGGTEKLKIERQNELEEVRQSAPLAARWRSEETGDAEQDEKRPRPRSAMRVTQSDDFWLKEKSDEKIEEEKLKVYKEIESIKQARLKFEDEPENRQENDARLKTLQELDSLRSNQRQLDNSVKKIKRDLEEINRNVAEKENIGKTSVVDFQTPTDQWKQEREKIKETYDTKVKFEEEVKPAMASPTKLSKITALDELPKMPKDIELTPSAEPDVENKDESIPLEEKAKSKLKELKNMEIFKLKEKTIKLTKKIEAERGRKRELKKTETKETATLRSKSISTLKNAGQKIKSMTNEKLKAVRKSKGGEDHEAEETKVDD